MGGSTGRRSRGSVEPSPLSGMAGGSGLSPRHWCDTLSRDQAMTAAMQLHRDACLMQTNLDILDQYALALHGTASKMLQKTIGAGHIPGSRSGGSGTGDARTTSFGPNGGIGTMETYNGPSTVRNSTMLKTACKECAVNL